MTSIKDPENTILAKKTKLNVREELEKKVSKQAEDLNERTIELDNTRRANLNLMEDIEEEREKFIAISAKDEAILSSIADGCIAVDDHGNIIVINVMAQKMLGYTEEESIGKPWYEILHSETEKGDPIPPEKGIIHGTLSVADMENGETRDTYEKKTILDICYYVRKNKTRFLVAITIAPIVLDNKIIGAIEIFRDITKEKEIDRAKSEFISIASHQLRTPLTGIQWVIERFTKKETLTEKGRGYLDNIHISVKHLTQLVDLLLNLSRIEAGKIGITSESVEVTSFLKSYLKEVAGLCEKKELKINFDDYPAELVVETDKNALRNIIQSLISNAIEYTPNGGKIDVALKKIDSVFVIKIRDTGIGIPETEQSHIFEKFVRATNAKLYKTDGTGIGLYIAERAVYLLGGKIWFESEENKGSVFYVELPVRYVPKEEIIPPAG